MASPMTIADQAGGAESVKASSDSCCCGQGSSLRMYFSVEIPTGAPSLPQLETFLSLLPP